MNEESIIECDDPDLQYVIESFNNLPEDESLIFSGVVNEYTTYGIFSIKSIYEEGIDIIKTPLYYELYNTLIHLTDVNEQLEYEMLTFTKDHSLKSNKAVNFSSIDVISTDYKHFEIYLYKKPSNLDGCCLVREIDGPSNIKSIKNNLSIKAVQSLDASSEIVELFPLLGYNTKKSVYIKCTKFHSNFGNPNHIEITLLRHFNVNDNRPLSPYSMLVELKCFGNYDVEYYKSIIQNYTKLLYKYVTF